MVRLLHGIEPRLNDSKWPSMPSTADPMHSLVELHINQCKVISSIEPVPIFSLGLTFQNILSVSSSIFKTPACVYQNNSENRVALSWLFASLRSESVAMIAFLLTKAPSPSTFKQCIDSDFIHLLQTVSDSPLELSPSHGAGMALQFYHAQAQLRSVFENSFQKTEDRAAQLKASVPERDEFSDFPTGFCFENRMSFPAEQAVSLQSLSRLHLYLDADELLREAHRQRNGEFSDCMAARAQRNLAFRYTEDAVLVGSRCLITEGENCSLILMRLS